MKKCVFIIFLLLSLSSFGQVKSGQSLAQSFTTLRADGTAATVDSGMAGVLDVDGVANGAAVTVTGGTAGLYKATVTLPVLTEGQAIHLRATYVIDGISTSQTIMMAVAVVYGGEVDLTPVTDLIGTPVSLNGGAATLGAMLSQIADGELGTFDASIDSLHNKLPTSDFNTAIAAVGTLLGTPAQAGEASTAATTVTDYLDANTMGFVTSSELTAAVTTIGEYITAGSAAVWTQLLSTLDDTENTVGHKLYNFLVYGKTGGTGT